MICRGAQSVPCSSGGYARLNKPEYPSAWVRDPVPKSDFLLDASEAARSSTDFRLIHVFDGVPY